MAILGPPPADLRRFPRRTLRRTVELFRIHRAGFHPWWFSSEGHGRFDLSPPSGTCYLALSPFGAFVEVFRDFTLVAAADVAARRLARLHLPDDVVLADCTSSRARLFGVTAAVHSTTDYATTQAWADAWRQAGFDGVRYYCGNDPSQFEVAVAIFGSAGEGGWPAAESTVIADDVLRSVEQRFGIHVLPAP